MTRLALWVCSGLVACDRPGGKDRRPPEDSATDPDRSGDSARPSDTGPRPPTDTGPEVPTDTAASLPRLRGRVDLDELADAEVLGTQQGDWLGYAVEAGADLTGDGLPDVAVGAPGPFRAYDGRDGRVYLLSELRGPRRAGPLAVLDLASTVLRGGAEGERAAGTTLAAGDLSGDGLADLLVDLGPFQEDRWVQLLPGPLPEGERWIGALTKARIDLGPSHQHATELNLRVGGDRAPTGLVVGSWGCRIAGIADDYTGAVFVVDGAVDGDVDLLEASSTVVYGRAARVTGVGASVVWSDLDGDGRRDLGIGIPSGDRERYPEQDQGMVSLLYGELPTGIVEVETAEVHLHGDTYRAGLGDALSAAGDFDGDGLGDLAIGGMGWPGDAGQLGEVRVSGVPRQPGDHSLGDTSFASMTGTDERGRFGMLLEAVGDLDGDGMDDLMVGGLGMVSLYYGPLAGAYVQDQPHAFLADYPSGLVALGDVDQDGFDDLGVGDYGAGGDEWNRGSLYLLYGGLGD